MSYQYWFSYDLAMWDILLDSPEYCISTECSRAQIWGGRRPSAAIGKGIPIGNLTSQLFANVYMNKFDQFVKHKLKVKNYCRYTDDFVIVADNRKYLQNLLPEIESFLNKKLKLKLHPEKVSIRKYQQGVDFLGYVVLPHHRLVRTKTKNRIFKRLKTRVQEFKTGLINGKILFQSLNSYLGVLSHASCYNLKKELKTSFGSG